MGYHWSLAKERPAAMREDDMDDFARLIERLVCQGVVTDAKFTRYSVRLGTSVPVWARTVPPLFLPSIQGTRKPLRRLRS